jgi:hypothetical protein
MQEMQKEIGEGAPPEGMNPTEIMVLHDAQAEQALVLVFFDSEEDYRKGDEILSAMPAGETPGRRTSVAKYDLAIRATP